MKILSPLDNNLSITFSLISKRSLFSKKQRILYYQILNKLPSLQLNINKDKEAIFISITIVNRAKLISLNISIQIRIKELKALRDT